jgi:two-component system LytT family response regulator
MTGTVLIADDEPLALRSLRENLRELGFRGELLEARDGLTAATLASRHRPELIFLDIVMPGLSGLQVLERLDYEPRVVFTTAFDHHAVTAFELGALDYLLKPFGRERVARVLERVAAAGKPEVPLLPRLQEQLHQGRPVRLFVRDGKRIVQLAVDQLERAQGADDYVTLHAGGKEYLASVRLADLEARLAGGPFLRIHRSHLVNLDFIEAVEPHDLGRVAVVLRSGARIVASRAGTRELKALTL